MLTRLWLSAILGLTPLAAAAFGPPPAAAPATSPAPATGPGAAESTSAFLQVPLFSEHFAGTPVALVEDEPITLRQLTDALAAMHEASAPAPGMVRKVEVIPVLDRLIEVRLIILEARNMEMEKLAVVERAVAAHRETTARELLKEQVTKDVKPDPALVDRLYRESVQTWKVRSVLCANESDAIRLKAEADGGKPFEQVARQAIADGKAKGSEEPQLFGRDKVLPVVLAALEKLKPGEVGAPLRLNEGFAVLKLDEIQYPEDAKAKERATAIARSEAHKAALKTYYEGMVKRWAKVDKKLLRSLDYTAKKPGLEALRKDPRVLARIPSGTSVTVADLTGVLAEGFFHGMEKNRSVNAKKDEVFDGILSRRVTALEAKRVGIDGSPELKKRVDEFQDGMLFSTFVANVIAPKAKVTDEEARKYYDAHRKDFTYPAFYKLESLAFATAKEAQAAVDKLASGTDFKWLNANSVQVKPAERKAKLEGTLAATALPKELADALRGARPGDHRLYADPSSQYYAVHVLDVVREQEQAFAEVDGKIRERLTGDAISAAVKEWAAKIRKATDVKVFITRIGS